MPVLAEHTTLRVGGPADAWIVAEDEQGAIAAVLAADSAGTPVLVLGGGSNLLVGDAGFPGVVVEMALRGIEADEVNGRVRLTVAAGEPWEDLVAHCVARGWAGIEALSGIPGRAGATPIQNVGAYGQDVSQVVQSVRALDRSTGQVRELTADECGFTYRASTFKREQGRWVVLSVQFLLSGSGRGPVQYAELASTLGVEMGDEAPVEEIASAVLAMRRAKGMVLDPADHDTWSAGSFFTNPIVDEATAATMPASCPRYPAAQGVKLSAAWLIEHAGVTRGFRVDPRSDAAVSTKHTLALTNRGRARAADLLALADAVRERVHTAFGVELVPEPTILA